MRFFFAAALAVARATAAPTPTVSPLEHSRDLARLIGTWDCQGSIAGNASVEEYAAGADGSVVLSNQVRASTGRAGTVIETFRFDSASSTWSLGAAANAFFGGLQLRGPAWTDARWVLTGTQVVNDRPRPARIVYTDLGPLGFRREHQVLANEAWQSDAQLLCRLRAPSTTPAASATPAASSPPGADVASRVTVVPRASALPTVATTPHASSVPLAPPRPAFWKFAPPASPTPGPSPHPTATPQAPDRAYDLVGTWACQTLTRDPSVHSYSLESDGSLRLVNRLRFDNRVFEIQETYRYNAPHRRWTNDTEHGAYRGSAARWVGDAWTFDGTATERGRSLPVRMLYQSLGTSAFRRDFQKPAAGGWTTYASETCSRGASRMP